MMQINVARRVPSSREQSWSTLFLAAALVTVWLSSAPSSPAQQRALGIDVSAWQTSISAANWATLKRATNQQVSGVFGDGRDFVIIRSSRGGTTGYYNQSDADNSDGLNTLSQRYDDPYFVQNITRATAAGLLAGSYHYARPEIIETTLNSAGIANTGADEANHMIEMAGAWMRPGYLLPVLDLESGQSQRSSAQMTAFCVEFADRIHAVMGIRPMIYINGNYANYVQSSIVTAIPNLWSARWPNQADPNSIPVQTGHPKDSYAPIYGPWDDAPNPTHPWTFWQYASTARLNGYANGGANIDVNVAQGGTEFLKDLLVPALWMNNSDGQWTTLTNWNSGLAPVAPVQGPGQVPRVGSLTLPAVRLPGIDDTVILDRPGANLVVTLASGMHNIRKLQVRETLNITGGALNVNYIPSWDSPTNAAQFSGAVTLSNSAGFSVHTLQVDATRTFTLGGGTLTFNTINLIPHASTPAKILVGGNVNFHSLSNVTATIARGAGSGNSGLIDLGGGATRAFNVTNGSAEVDLSVDVPISNGALTKTGAGTMRLNSASTYSGGTTLTAGRLLANSPSGSGTGSGGVTVDGGFLGGTGAISGVVTVNSAGTIAPGTASTFGRLTLNSVPIFGGTNFMRINRNGGTPLNDKLHLTSGTLNYGGTLVVSNAGASLTGGEVFTNFTAVTYSGAFTAMTLPPLGAGLNWYTGLLATNGSLRVNRSPVANPSTITNHAPLVLQIPIASLLANDTDADGDAPRLTGIHLTTTNGITLVTNSTFIFYSNYVSSLDRIDYTISDGRGGSATGAVHIASSPTGRFTGAPLVTGNAVTLHFAGRPGWTYYVERSTNLIAWTTISTNVAPTSGVFDYVDTFPDLPQPPATAFYRLRWLE